MYIPLHTTDCACAAADTEKGNRMLRDVSRVAHIVVAGIRDFPLRVCCAISTLQYTHRGEDITSYTSLLPMR